MEKNFAPQLKTLSKEVSEMATDLRGDAVMEVSAALGQLLAICAYGCGDRTHPNFCEAGKHAV
jgi:hypothetical protein